MMQQTAQKVISLHKAGKTQYSISQVFVEGTAEIGVSDMKKGQNVYHFGPV